MGQEQVKVRIVDTDVHPTLQSDEQMASYLPERVRSSAMGAARRRPRGSSPNWFYYELPDFVNAGNARYDAKPANGPPGSDPDFAFKQLIVDAKVDLGILSPLMFPTRLPELDNLRCETLNNWLIDDWLTKHNQHGRWRGSISVSNRDPAAAATEIERVGDHPMLVRVMLGHAYSGTQIAGGYLDPIFAAATRHQLPVAIHLGSTGPYEFTPISPVGQGSQGIEWYANSVTLLFASHVMSLVFDGAFERFKDLKITFIEGSVTWVLPIMWRMDRVYKERRSELPLVKRKPSEYVKEHIRFATQPMDDPQDIDDYKQYIEWLDPAALLTFSSDYPHLTFDDPSWAMQRFPKTAVERIMAKNAIEFYDLPEMVPAIPD